MPGAFLAAAETYMAAVTDATLPYLATHGGRVILWQADNEIDPQGVADELWSYWKEQQKQTRGGEARITAMLKRHRNVYMADLSSGYVDRLVLANSRDEDRSPRFVDSDGDGFVFVSDRSGDARLLLFHLASGVIDTLPIAHDVGEDDDLRGGDTGGGSGSLFGGRLGGLGARSGRFGF